MKISGIYNNYRPYGTAYRSKPSFRGEECEEGYGPYVVSMAKNTCMLKIIQQFLFLNLIQNDLMKTS